MSAAALTPEGRGAMGTRGDGHWAPERGVPTVTSAAAIRIAVGPWNSARIRRWLELCRGGGVG